MDSNTTNTYGQNPLEAPSSMPPQAMGQVPVYPNTSQLYDPVANDRPKPDWQQAIYNNLANQQTVPYEQPAISVPLAYDVAKPPQSSPVPPRPTMQPMPPVPQQYAYTAPQPTPPQAAYAVIADSTNAPLSDIVVSDEYGAPRKSGKKRIIFRVAIILLLIGSIGAVGMGAYKFGYAKGLLAAQSMVDTTSESQEENTPNSNEEVTDVLPPELDFSMQLPEYKDELVTGGVGETLIAADGLVLLAYNVTRNYQPEDKNTTSTGTEIIKVDIVIGNADETGKKTVSSDNFSLLDTEDTVTKPLKVEGDSEEISLEPGTTNALSLLFELSSKTSNFALNRVQGYRVGGVIRTTILQVGLTEGWQSQDSDTSSL